MKVFLKKHGKLLSAAFLLSLLPLICCLVHCGVQGYSIRDVYLPASEWNDELFYFKQVEGILKNGYPYGYFGFNESHAAKLSFAAWSPVLVIPWVLWGFVFGWNLLSPIWCNIFLMGLAIFLFVLLVKPQKKQMLTLAVLYCLFPMFTRYILSGMPEIICISFEIKINLAFYIVGCYDINETLFAPHDVPSGIFLDDKNKKMEQSDWFCSNYGGKLRWVCFDTYTAGGRVFGAAVQCGLG